MENIKPHVADSTLLVVCSFQLCSTRGDFTYDLNANNKGLKNVITRTYIVEN